MPRVLLGPVRPLEARPTEVGAPGDRVDLFPVVPAHVPEVGDSAGRQSQPERIAEPVRPDPRAVAAGVPVPERVAAKAAAVGRDAQDLSPERVQILCAQGERAEAGAPVPALARRDDESSVRRDLDVAAAVVAVAGDAVGSTRELRTRAPAGAAENDPLAPAGLEPADADARRALCRAVALHVEHVQAL